MNSITCTGFLLLYTWYFLSEFRAKCFPKKAPGTLIIEQETLKISKSISQPMPWTNTVFNFSTQCPMCFVFMYKIKVLTFYLFIVRGPWTVIISVCPVEMLKQDFYPPYIQQALVIQLL